MESDFYIPVMFVLNLLLESEMDERRWTPEVLFDK